MIRAIIFDCYGVLVDDALPEFVKRHFVDNTETTKLVWEFDDEVNLGKRTIVEFHEFLAERLGMSIDEVAIALDKNTCNQPLMNYIRDELKPQHKIALLSNMAYDMLDKLIGSTNRALFDVEVLSFAEGAVKPDETLYFLAAKRLGLQTNECLFIDDKERYCEGARKVGMWALCYRSLDELRAKITTQEIS